MWSPADAFWVWCAATAVALCASRARRWTLVWMSVPAAALGVGVGRVSGCVALVSALALLWGKWRDRRVRTGVAGFAVVGLLSMALPSAIQLTGATAVIAVIAALPAIWSAGRRARTRERRSAAIALAILGTLIIVGAVSATALTATVASPALDAIEASDEAVSLAADEDSEAAAQRFSAAAEQFDAVVARASGWWVLPARFAPIIGANVNLISVALESGAQLNRTAADLAVEVDQSALSRPSGGVDLAVLESYKGPADQAVAAVVTARNDLTDANSPWLLPPIKSRLGELDGSLEDAERSAETVSLVAETLPSMLGADGPVRYLLLLGNPAELRDVGGHVGNWAELVAEDGRLKLVEVGAPYELFTPLDTPPATLTSGAYPVSLEELRPQYFPQNWGGSPDMDTVARLASELFPQARPGGPIEGVIYADPTAFAALLELTGGVEVPTTDITLTSENAVRFLTVDQFLALTDAPAGTDPLGDAIETAVRRFADNPLPLPDRLAKLFGPVLVGGHLQMSTLDPDRNSLLDRIGLRRTLGRTGEEDILAVVNRNANPSKADAFLRRSVTYDVQWQPGTGQIRSTVTVTLTNEIPETGLDEDQVKAPPATPLRTNRTQLSILTPLSAAQATRDGERVPFGTQAESPSVFRHNVWIELAPGQTATVSLDLTGRSDAEFYRLHYLGQPALNNEPTTVRVSELGDTLERRGTVVEERFPAGEDRIIEFAPDEGIE
ncbi:MAG: DUF4012 domain-containing protein [Actinobacteria bacterium]|nr:DUF4012 domain-containing protein [Actinomycetota bacterium]